MKRVFVLAIDMSCHLYISNHTIPDYYVYEPSCHSHRPLFRATYSSWRGQQSPYPIADRRSRVSLKTDA